MTSPASLDAAIGSDHADAISPSKQPNDTVDTQRTNADTPRHVLSLVIQVQDGELVGQRRPLSPCRAGSAMRLRDYRLKRRFQKSSCWRLGFIHIGSGR